MLGYKVNISFLTEKYHIPKFVVQKWVRPKKRRQIFVQKLRRLNSYKTTDRLIGLARDGYCYTNHLKFDETHHLKLIPHWVKMSMHKTGLTQIHAAPSE